MIRQHFQLPVKRQRPRREIPEVVRVIALGRIELALLAGNREECEAALDAAFAHEPVTSVDQESHVAELGLSERIVGRLERAGIWRVGQLCSYTREELLAFHGNGPCQVDEIAAALARVGLELRRSIIEELDQDEQTTPPQPQKWA